MVHNKILKLCRAFLFSLIQKFIYLLTFYFFHIHNPHNHPLLHGCNLLSKKTTNQFLVYHLHHLQNNRFALKLKFYWTILKRSGYLVSAVFSFQLDIWEAKTDINKKIQLFLLDSLFVRNKDDVRHVYT